MQYPNVMYSDDWHTNVDGGFYVSIVPNGYDESASTLAVLYLAKDAAVGTAPTALDVTGIVPNDNEPAIHQAISDQVVADAAA